MDKITLTNGLKVSPVCLGAMMFGTTTSKRDSYSIIDAFLDLGGNFIDTSNNYAHWVGTGDESETLLGEWLKEHGGRDKLVIATKVGFDRHGKGAGLRKEQIEYWVDESLRKLNTDYIDLYYAHTDDLTTPIEETMEAFNRLVEKGKVRAIGGSNYDTWRFSEYNLTAQSKGLAPYTVMQQQFSYLYQRADASPGYTFNEYVTRERLRYLEEKNIPLVSYSCLLKGGYEAPERMPDDMICGPRLDFIKNLAREKGVSTSTLVIAWLLNLHRTDGFPQIIPLFSSSKAEHFVKNCTAVDIVLSDDEMNMLNKA